MAHIHHEAGQHDHTVSFFIVRTDGDEPRITYHVHRRTGKLSMFGGHVELDETPWQAALRETLEETGYSHEQLRILQPAKRLKNLTDAVVHPMPVVSHTGRYPDPVPHFHTDLMYAFVASEEPAGSPEEGESTDIRLFTVGELALVSPEEIFEVWREIGQYILEHIYEEWVQLPLEEFQA